MLISVIVAFFGLLIIGVPIAHVVLGAAGIGCLMTGTTGTILAQQTVLGMNSYVMLAVPFFILSGDLAAKGQTSQRLVNAINAFLGHLPGGLGIATIFACAIFGEPWHYHHRRHTGCYDSALYSDATDSHSYGDLCGQAVYCWIYSWDSDGCHYERLCGHLCQTHRHSSDIPDPF